jgi:hypothetical protein
MVIWNVKLYKKCELTKANLCWGKWICFIKGFTRNVLQSEFGNANTKWSLWIIILNMIWLLFFCNYTFDEVLNEYCKSFFTPTLANTFNLSWKMWIQIDWTSFQWNVEFMDLLLNLFKPLPMFIISNIVLIISLHRFTVTSLFLNVTLDAYY